MSFFSKLVWLTFSMNNAETESQEDRGSCWQRTKSTLGNLLTMITFGFGLKLFFALIKELVEIFVAYFFYWSHIQVWPGSQIVIKTQIFIKPKFHSPELPKSVVNINSIGIVKMEAPSIGNLKKLSIVLVTTKGVACK